MKISVEEGRFISVPCDPTERIVFDRRAGTYHLLQSTAARLWGEIEGGGVFEFENVAAEDSSPAPFIILAEAGLVQLSD